MTHLTPDELIDAMEEALAPGRQAHLASCEECRRQVDDLAGALGDAKQANVPEPSPLFWNHFSQRVRAAIDQEQAPAGAWPGWLRWQVLLPLGAAAMLILGLMMTMPIEQTPPDQSAAFEPAPLEPAGESWVAVEELVGQLDIETASAAGVIEPGVT
ncbi:MAG TPA: hypothetical protein VFZ31_15695, partial [Vicinamibacterales bacterium]